MAFKITFMNNRKLIKCFEEGLGLPERAIVETLAYQIVPEWDSTAHMALVAVIEQEFNIMLTTDDIIAMNCVPAVRSILEKHGVTFDAA